MCILICRIGDRPLLAANRDEAYARPFTPPRRWGAAVPFWAPRVGEEGGGSYRPHTLLFDAFLPALRSRDLGEAEIQTLVVLNPARAFAVRRRLSAPAGPPR